MTIFLECVYLNQQTNENSNFMKKLTKTQRKLMASTFIFRQAAAEYREGGLYTDFLKVVERVIKLQKYPTIAESTSK